MQVQNEPNKLGIFAGKKKEKGIGGESEENNINNLNLQNIT